MDTDTDRTGSDAEACTTTGSFADHAVDGQRVTEAAYRRLAAAEQRTVSDSDRFYEQLESAFLWA